MKPFSRIFLSQWNFSYHEALFMIFFFFTMELWLSRSLSHEFFLFHDGILSIKEPFPKTFSFSRWNSGYQGAFHMNFFFFMMEFTKCMIWGKTLSTHTHIYIYIYIKKSIYIRSASLKTLPPDLEPPLQRKRKLLFFPNITYGHVIRLF
jgi:hypothetical protein